MISVAEEADAGLVTTANLYAAWLPKIDEAVDRVTALLPHGSRVRPDMLTPVSDAMFRELRLKAEK